MVRSVPNKPSYHIIPIILFFRATIGDMDPPSMLHSAALHAPSDLRRVPGFSGVKEWYTEYEYKIYGLNDTNTLYTAHDFDIHTLLSQPASSHDYSFMLARS